MMIEFYRIRKGQEVLVVLLKISLSAKLANFVPWTGLHYE